MSLGTHVSLRSVLEFDEEDSQLRFDEASRRLVLIKHREFVATSIDGHPLIRCHVGGKVENVRFSLNHRLAAVQRSDVEIEFVDLLLGEACQVALHQHQTMAQVYDGASLRPDTANHGPQCRHLNLVRSRPVSTA